MSIGVIHSTPEEIAEYKGNKKVREEAASRRASEAEEVRLRVHAALGITPEQVAAAPQITPELRMIARTLRREGQPKRVRRDKIVNSGVDSTDAVTVSTAIDDEHSAPYGPGTDLLSAWPHYLASDDHDDALKVLLAYRSVPRYRGRDRLPIEAYCVAAKVSPLTILGILVGSIVRMGVAARTVIAMVNHPRIVQKSVEMALTDEGIEDRTLLARATGFLPTPKGSQTIINVEANASAQSASPVLVAAPPPEQTIRRAVDRFNDARLLPSAPPPSILEQFPRVSDMQPTQHATRMAPTTPTPPAAMEIDDADGEE